MKDIYAWVPWFHNLARRIADDGRPLLIELAKTVHWYEDRSKSPPLLNYGDENLDPFSFFNYLAGRSYRRENRARIYPSINQVAGTPDLPPLDRADAFLFPASPSVAALFHNRGDGRPDLLWSLFRSAVSAEFRECRIGCRIRG